MKIFEKKKENKNVVARCVMFAEVKKAKILKQRKSNMKSLHKRSESLTFPRNH